VKDKSKINPGQPDQAVRIKLRPENPKDIGGGENEASNDRLVRVAFSALPIDNVTRWSKVT
jgi:hypothetical protein